MEAVTTPEVPQSPLPKATRSRCRHRRFETNPDRMSLSRDLPSDRSVNHIEWRVKRYPPARWLKPQGESETFPGRFTWHRRAVRLSSVVVSLLSCGDFEKQPSSRLIRSPSAWNGQRARSRR